jgi:hypothetical protein
MIRTTLASELVTSALAIAVVRQRPTPGLIQRSPAAGHQQSSPSDQLDMDAARGL